MDFWNREEVASLKYWASLNMFVCTQKTIQLKGFLKWSHFRIPLHKDKSFELETITETYYLPAP